MSTRSARTRGWSLFALCALLITLIALEHERGVSLADATVTSDEAAEQPSSAKPHAVPGATLALPALQQFNEIVDRTLFEVSRRPAEEAEETPAAAATELRGLTLTGVVITPDAKVAFFRDKTPNQIIRLEKGGALGKWLLDDVHDNGVTLRRGTASHELRLHEVDVVAQSRTLGTAQAAMGIARGEGPASLAKASAATQARAGNAKRWSRLLDSRQRAFRSRSTGGE